MCRYIDCYYDCSYCLYFDGVLGVPGQQNALPPPLTHRWALLFQSWVSNQYFMWMVWWLLSTFSFLCDHSLHQCGLSDLSLHWYNSLEHTHDRNMCLLMLFHVPYRSAKRSCSPTALRQWVPHTTYFCVLIGCSHSHLVSWTFSCLVTNLPWVHRQVSTLAHFQPQLGCEDYTFIDQALKEFEHGPGSMFTDFAQTADLDASLGKPVSFPPLYLEGSYDQLLPFW